MAPRGIKETYTAKGEKKVTQYVIHAIVSYREREESADRPIIRREENQKSRIRARAEEEGKKTADASKDRREDRARGEGADTAVPP